MSAPTIPSIESFTDEFYKLDPIHIALLHEINELKEKVNKLEILKGNDLKEKLKWVKEHSSKVDTKDLHQYKCKRRRDHDARIEEMSNFLFNTFAWAKHIFLCPEERNKIRTDLTFIKKEREKFTETRELPVLNEDGSIQKGKTIKVKSQKSVEQINREFEKNGALLISKDITDSIEEESSCCSCDCCKTGKKGSHSAISVQLHNLKKEVLKKSKEEFVNAIPFKSLV